MATAKTEYLRAQARLLRQTALTMIYHAQSGHPGGSLSASDIVAALYFDEMRIDPKKPRWEQRDRFILSKGHCCPILYAALAMRGFFDPSELNTLRRFESILQGHPDMNKTPGVDMTTGSLGQGLSDGAGMAFGLKYDQNPARVFVLLGDGETDEGQVWEAAAFAAKYKLGNLIAIVDCNSLQNDGPCEEVMPLGDMPGKWRGFGWRVLEADGHDIGEILDAMAQIRDYAGEKPTCLLARTVKGKYVSFMENVVEWHGKAPDDAEYRAAMEELNAHNRTHFKQ